MIASRAAASSGVSRWPRPSRAVAALAAEPAKKGVDHPPQGAGRHGLGPLDGL